MSVIVKGMEMPQDCDSCWIPGSFCQLWLTTDVDNRHQDCPLVALPEKHGRLIDADALCDGLGVSDEDICFKHMLEECQTIVEAEGADG